MNIKLSITYLILIITPLFFGCHGTVKKEAKNNASASPLSLHIGDDNYLAIDTKQSVVEWKGANLIGPNGHTGYVYIFQGELLIENDQLMGVTVEVDMNTIEDNNHGRNNNLVNHLKNVDFFDVGKFPFSTIVITKVVPVNKDSVNLTGNLTIKGITNPVTFPAKMEIKSGAVKISSKLVIDRTKWNVLYKSGKFFDTLANQTISDSIEFHIKIVAKK